LAKGKLTQIIKTAHQAHLAERAPYLSRMESGHFAGFSENGSFGKPGILRGDRGSSPPFFMTPRIHRVGGISGDDQGVVWGERPGGKFVEH
jgi:hypothetical protein